MSSCVGCVGRVPLHSIGGVFKWHFKKRPNRLDLVYRDISCSAAFEELIFLFVFHLSRLFTTSWADMIARYTIPALFLSVYIMFKRKERLARFRYRAVHLFSRHPGMR